jgi:Flp pilus assembly protein TadG
MPEVSVRSLSQRVRSTRKCDRRGAAAVEFAIVAPLFFLLLAGIIEFGQAFRIEHALSNASRRGVRAAAVEDSTNSQVEQLVRAHVANTLGVSESDVTVNIAVNGAANGNLAAAVQGDEVSVTVSVPFSEAGVGFFAYMFSSSNLSSTSILEHE